MTGVCLVNLVQLERLDPQETLVLLDQEDPQDLVVVKVALVNLD